MPATLSDKTEDRFTELFGTGRGAGRPEEDTPTVDAQATDDPSAETQPTGLSFKCATTGCAGRVEKSSAFRLSPALPFYYCSKCLPTARSVEEKARKSVTGTVDTYAKRTITESRRAKKNLRQQEHHANKRRFRKCYFSRPFGHVWKLPEKSPFVMVRGTAYVCAGCGKIKCSNK